MLMPLSGPDRAWHRILVSRGWHPATEAAGGWASYYNKALVWLLARNGIKSEGKCATRTSNGCCAARRQGALEVATSRVRVSAAIQNPRYVPEFEVEVALQTGIQQESVCLSYLTEQVVLKRRGSSNMLDQATREAFPAGNRIAARVWGAFLSRMGGGWLASTPLERILHE